MSEIKDNSKTLKRLKKDERLLKYVINKLFTFGDLKKGLKNVDSSTGNINCPFHKAEGLEENTSQSAKVYYDEYNNIYTIRCFTTENSYTCYHFIFMVLDEDPYTYLLDNRETSDIIDIIDIVDKGYVDLSSNIYEERVNYVNNLFEEVDCNVVEYISRLYNPK